MSNQTILAEFLTYTQSCYGTVKLQPEQLKDLRQTFFCGAMVMGHQILQINIDVAAGKLSPEDGAKQLDDLLKEVEEENARRASEVLKQSTQLPPNATN